MNEITPEKLKVIAEGMGYNAVIKPRNIRGSVSDAVWLVDREEWYEPHLTNAEQCMEIMEKLEVNVLFISKCLWQAVVGLDFGMTGGVDGRGKTINEAVCNAAYEYFKESRE